MPTFSTVTLGRRFLFQSDFSNNFCFTRFSLKKDYTEALKSQFNAIAKELDFVGKKAAAIETINGDAKSATKGLIDSIIDDIDSMTRLILMNAIYFKGDWKIPFKTENTEDGDFKLTSGQTVKAKMMFKREKYPYKHSEKMKCSFVKLPYKSEQISMVIVLPDEEQTVHGVLKLMNRENLTERLNKMRNFMEVNLKMPKFKLASKHNLIPTLGQLGVSSVFGENADLSGISEAEKLYVSDVVQKAVIEVDEKGTVAAAVTGMMMRCMMLPPSVDVFLDRPFVFLILSNDNNTLLFSGVVENPTSE